MTTKALELNAQNKTLLRKAHVVQNDSGRVLKCFLADITIPQGSTARIYATKPSGKEVYNDCIIEGNAVRVDLTTQMIAEVGDTVCQIELSCKGKSVTTFCFLLVVEKRLSSDTAVESSNEYSALENLIISSQTAMQSCNAATATANEAAQEANTAANQATTAAGAANTAAGTAEQAASSASSAAGQATSAAGAANNAASTANAAAQSANNAAAAAEAAAGGDISVKTVTFQMATERANVQSGDDLATAFGKLAKFCQDLKSHAFADTVKNLETTEEGYALDATMGAEIAERLDGLNTKINRNIYETSDSSKAGCYKDVLFVSLADADGPENINICYTQTPNNQYISGLPDELIGKDMVAYRRVHYRGSNHVLIELLEAFPVTGRVWYIFYNSGSWSGWKRHDPD